MSIVFFLLFTYLFWVAPCSIWDPKFLDQGLNLHRLKWKHAVLTTGSPGKSPLLLTMSSGLGFSMLCSQVQSTPSGRAVEALIPKSYLFPWGSLHITTKSLGRTQWLAFPRVTSRGGWQRWPSGSLLPIWNQFISELGWESSGTRILGLLCLGERFCL